MPVSPHGMVIAALQFIAILVVLWVNQRWQAKRSAAGAGAGAPTTKPPLVLSMALVLEYAILRYQPIRMGGDPFAYSLGIFDAVTVFGLVMLWWPRPTRSA